MKRNKLWILTVSLAFIMAFGAVAQKSGKKSSVQKAKVEKTAGSRNEEKVKDVVAFLQLLLNTLGSSATSARDKEVVISESYDKIFRDAKVQIEDDLDEARKTITNKDVVAYFKDIDFFFEDVKFEFIIEGIEEGVNANGNVFYKVSLRRNLSGTTANGKTVNNTIPRFIEINYDPEDDDLKIASIYTNEFDERESLTSWWKSLSFEWQSIFKRKLNIIDSVDLNGIKDIKAIVDLDLSNNQYIHTIEPLGQLTNLKLLNLSGTNVADLTPIRNLTELIELNLSGTKIFDLLPLRYSGKMLRLNINHTEIRSVEVLEKMPQMQNLEMQATHVIDFTPVSNLAGLLNLDMEGTQITELSPIAALDQLIALNISKTFIRDLKGIKGLMNLKVLNIDSTGVRDISTLHALENLEVLHANYTLISNLDPLLKLGSLQRIYCDQTQVNKTIADAFMTANPGVLVIYDSKDLQAWWQTLSSGWQNLLSSTAKISSMPGKEELARVTNLDSINLSGNVSIQDLEALRKLQKLQVVIASNAPINDLSPLEDHREIRYLDLSDTEVNDLSVLRKFTKLNVLRADRSKIESIDPLFNIKTLKELYVDRTTVHDIIAREFLENNPHCLIIYKTIHLDRWWGNLAETWKEVFHSQMAGDTTSTRENLHRLVEQETLHFQEARVRDLTALSEFVRLKELHFSATAITEIPDLDQLKSLKSLHATNSPLQRIGALSQLRDLEDLDISNTPIDDLRGLEALQNLRSLNCAGTQIKKLDPLSALQQLESFDCSNTSTRKLGPLNHLSLRTLKCYNTKISGREVDNFRESNPDCNIVYYR